MAFFVGSEERARQKATEKNLLATSEVLHDEAVMDTLVKTGENLTFIVDELLYVPNVRHGVVTKPNSVKHESAIPVLTLTPGEELLIDPKVARLMPIQTRQYLDYLKSLGVSDDAIQRMANKLDNVVDEFHTNNPLRADITERYRGAVYSSLMPLTAPAPKYGGRVIERNLISRPVVAFSAGYENDAYQGLVGLHEAVHVLQAFRSPIRKPDTESLKRHELSRELEAYHCHALAARSLYLRSANAKFKGNPSIVPESIFRIEDARRKENGSRKNPFEPSGALRNLIAEELGFDLVG